MNNWFNHFKNLLGNALKISNEDEIITKILDNPGIEEGSFTAEEYDKAKLYIVEGKSCGKDGIPPEMLKRCGLVHSQHCTNP